MPLVARSHSANTYVKHSNRSRVPHKRPQKLVGLSKTKATQQQQIQKYSEDLTFDKNDIIIAVMGATGVGKSTFISLLSDAEIQIGHGLQSFKSTVQDIGLPHQIINFAKGTSAVGVYYFLLQGVRVWLIDTPGFDDTSRSDAEVLNDIAFWLAAAYTQETQLADKEGKRISEEVGQQRIKELTETNDFWGEMVDRGSKIERHDGTKESARSIVSNLVDRKIRVTLDIQKDLIDRRMSVFDTNAGQALQAELIEELQRSEARLADLKQDTCSAFQEEDKEWQKEIEKDRTEFETDIKKGFAETEDLKTHMKKMANEERTQIRTMDAKRENEFKHFAAQTKASTDATEAFEAERREKEAPYYAPVAQKFREKLAAEGRRVRAETDKQRLENIERERQVLQERYERERYERKQEMAEAAAAAEESRKDWSGQQAEHEFRKARAEEERAINLAAAELFHGTNKTYQYPVTTESIPGPSNRLAHDFVHRHMQAITKTYEALTPESPIDLNESDDAFSEISSEPLSLISDSTNSSMQGKYNDIVEHLVEILCTEQNIGLIYRKAVENFPRDKFRHNHDQLLKLYFKQLRHETRTENEKAAIRTLRTRRCRNEITSLVLNFWQPFEESGESRLTASVLAKRKTERNYGLNQTLQGSPVNPYSYNDHKTQQEDNIDHDGYALESSWSSTDSEDERLTENQQSPLQAIDAFLASGKAFSHLKVNLSSLLHPPLSFEDALSTESMFVVKQYIFRNLKNMTGNVKEKVLELRAKGQSNAKIAEFLLENTVVLPVTTVKRNLKPASAKQIMASKDDAPTDEAAPSDGQMLASETALMQPALTGQAEREKPQQHNRPQLVTWTCSCGVQLFDHYTEIVPGSLEQLQQRLRQENSSPSSSCHNFWDSLVAWTTTRPSIAHSSSNDQANTAFNAGTAQAVQEDSENNGESSIPRKASPGPAAKTPPLSKTTEISSTLQSPQVHPAVSYLLLCFPEGLSGLRLHHQQILQTARLHSLSNQVTNDKQLFHLLRKRYASERRLFISNFWPKTVIRVSLAYFLVDLSEYVEPKHYACQDGRADCKCIPPPEMIQPAADAQYHCFPRDPQLKPPIGTNYLTHYFQNPDCIKSENLVCTLNQVPKRLGQCMATSGSQRVEAWGMEFEEGWDRGRLRNAIFGIVVIGCFIFAILWSVLLKNMQSAFGVSSFIVALLATIGGYIASAGPRIVHK